MTFGEYIKTIIHSVEMSATRDTFATGLFNSLQPEKDAIEGTVKRWIDVEAPKSFATYFPTGEVDKESFLVYLKGWTSHNWKKLQENFCGVGMGRWTSLQKKFYGLNMENIVNGTTMDSEEFYHSLFNQFLVILKLPQIQKKEPIAIILKSTPLSEPVLFGRENELDEITSILNRNNYAALLGIGGIGKSHIALAYAYGLQKSGTVVVQRVICEETDSIRSIVEQFQFEGLKDDKKKNKFDAHLEALNNHQKPALVIFDNFNCGIRSKDYDDFKAVVRCNPNIKFLFTSRHERVLGDEKQHIVKIEPLENDILLKLYARHRFRKSGNHDDYIDKHRPLLQDMFATVHNHTLIVELLAKLCRDSDMNEEEINEKLKKGLDISPEEIYLVKDDKALEANILEIIKMIFDLSSLDETEKDILRHLSLVPPSGMGLNLFKELAEYKRGTEIIRLREKGWIMMDDKTRRIWLHPLICETVFNDDSTKPSNEICHVFYKNVEEKCGNELFFNKELSMSEHIDLIKTSARCTSKMMIPDLFVSEEVDGTIHYTATRPMEWTTDIPPLFRFLLGRLLNKKIGEDGLDIASALLANEQDLKAENEQDDNSTL